MDPPAPETAVTLRLPDALRQRLDRLATAQRRSRHAQILHLLEAAVGLAEADRAAPDPQPR